MDNIIEILLVFISGTLGALLGVGGGIFLMPSLLLFSTMAPNEAIQLALLGTLLTSIIGLLREPTMLRNTFNKAIVIVPLALVGAGIGTLLSHRFSERMLLLSLAILLFCVGISFTRRSLIPLSITRFNKSSAGFLAGTLSGLLGIGGGTILVPMMRSFLKTPIKEAVYVSFFVMFFTSSFALSIHYAKDSLRLTNECLFCLAVVPAGFIGGRLRQSFDEIKLSRIFMAYSFCMGAVVLLRALVG